MWVPTSGPLNPSPYLAWSLRHCVKHFAKHIPTVCSFQRTFQTANTVPYYVLFAKTSRNRELIYKFLGFYSLKWGSRHSQWK